MEFDEPPKYDDVNSEEIEVVVKTPEKMNNGDTVHQNGDVRHDDLNT